MAIELKNKDDKTSYALGMDIGASFRNLPVNINLEAAIAGVKDVFTGTKPVLAQQEFVGIDADDDIVLPEQFGLAVRQKAQPLFLGRNYLTANAFNGFDMGWARVVFKLLVFAVEPDVQVFLAQLRAVVRHPLFEEKSVVTRHCYRTNPLHAAKVCFFL